MEIVNLENWSIEEVQNVMKHHYKFDNEVLNLCEGKKLITFKSSIPSLKNI
jgi:hypothetical protein